MSNEIVRHQDNQDNQGTICELTVHDSPPQNGTVECSMHALACFWSPMIYMGRSNETFSKTKH